MGKLRGETGNKQERQRSKQEARPDGAGGWCRVGRWRWHHASVKWSEVKWSAADWAGLEVRRDSWLKHRERFRHSLLQEGFVFGVIHSHRVWLSKQSETPASPSLSPGHHIQQVNHNVLLHVNCIIPKPFKCYANTVICSYVEQRNTQRNSHLSPHRLQSLRSRILMDLTISNVFSNLFPRAYYLKINIIRNLLVPSVIFHCLSAQNTNNSPTKASDQKQSSNDRCVWIFKKEDAI